ncbi:MAG: Histidine kinase [Devosia sp.]|uniref:hybrid sensor histidine kinase/response regulator n=1 Tax=Devosia sp. TaxID=1871048 RepID=UPI00260454C9|nr:PAS domain-containing sensor histidine kinase [Devosia sp.]MDB5530414.1 Histidine kinase [Devosia sp.]
MVERGNEGDRYRLLVDSIVDYAIYMLDPTGTVVSWNAGAQRFKGYEASEIVGQHFSKFYTEDDRRSGLPQRALQTAMDEGKFEQEGWRVRKDGSHMWAHVVIDPIRDSSGVLIGFAKVTRDLSERKAAEKALLQSQDQFRLLVQSVTDYALYMLTPEGNVSSWNIGAQRIKGYSAEEIIGHHFSQFYTPEDRAQGLPERALQLAREEGRFEREGWRVRKDGSRFWANVIIDPVRDANGVLVGFAKVTRDITERQQTQQALEQAREAAFQSQKTEALGQLTGGIAHDFNNLLMVILSSLELAQKRLPDDPKLKRLLANARQGAQRGASLTQRMLAFARKQELKAEPTNVPLLVGGMLDLLERSLGPSVEITTEFPQDLPLALADANQLELAILNLAVNARDAMVRAGRIAIGGKAAIVSPGDGSAMLPGSYVCVSVEDNGAGMDSRTLARAAEPFFTTKGVGKGTGLGLSMVKGMVEQSGGQLLIRSVEGSGTTVEIWLPIANRDPTSMSAQRKDDVEEEGQRSAVILAVDDDPLVLENVADMLEDLGYRVLKAASGPEALKILAGDAQVDLVLTDHVMPIMTGLQLVDQMRDFRPRLPALLASGYADMSPSAPSTIARLTKPFRQAELARAVSTALA